MSGPTAMILLPRELTEAQVADIRRSLDAISIEVCKSEIWDWEFWVSRTVPIGGGYVGEGRPFAIISKPVEWETPEEPAILAQEFGFEPQQRLQLDGLCNGKQDHAIMGSLLLHFARLFGGLVDFNGALLPPRVQWRWEDDWSGVAGDFEKMVEDMPGKIVSIMDDAMGGRTCAHHVADAAFTEAWLSHPFFHVIK